MQINASIITIGDELLIGQTVDTNSACLGVELNKLGVWVRQRVAVGDVAAHITNALQDALQISDIVIITGGLGPTADDITKPLLCDFFGGTLIQNAAVEAHVRAFFEKRKRPIIDVNIKQASVPDCCEVLWNQYGTAPGMLFRRDNKLVFSLPGVPLEMKDIMTTSGFDAIAKNFTLPRVSHRTICTAGKGESFIAIALRDFEASLPAHIKLAYLPALGQVKLRLTSLDGSEEELNSFTAALQKQVAHICYATTDISLQEAILQQLLARQQTLAFAESCTGGYLSHLFTNISGASAAINGSAVVYTNEAKSKVLGIDANAINTHGAVSEHIATLMAQQTRAVYSSNFSLSTTGYLESTYTQEAQIWICASDGTNHKTVHHTLPYYRERNKELAANYALLLLWRLIQEAAQS
ncbi:MAG: hypothetical protein RL660_3100 [Bacteroidota bacterium]|jgi:nicotinamide-nucleotide amidase